MNDWFKSYLIGRKQYTTVNGYISDSHRILCGVPQDSVLGPLLFLLYINDLYKSSNKLQFYLFADDTSLTYANGDLKKLETEINEELFKVCSWLVVNKLTLNIEKTNYIIFRPRQKTIPFHPYIKIINNNSDTSQPLETGKIILDILVYSLIRTFHRNFIQTTFVKKSVKQSELSRSSDILFHVMYFSLYTAL